VKADRPGGDFQLWNLPYDRGAMGMGAMGMGGGINSQRPQLLATLSTRAVRPELSLSPSSSAR